MNFSRTFDPRRSTHKRVCAKIITACRVYAGLIAAAVVSMMVCCHPEVVTVSEQDVYPPEKILRDCGQTQAVSVSPGEKSAAILLEIFKEQLRSLLSFQKSDLDARIAFTDATFAGGEFDAEWYYFNRWVYLDFSFFVALDGLAVDFENPTDDERQALADAMREKLDEGDYQPLYAQEVGFEWNYVRQAILECCGDNAPVTGCPQVRIEEGRLLYSEEIPIGSGSVVQAQIDLYSFGVTCDNEPCSRSR